MYCGSVYAMFDKSTAAAGEIVSIFILFLFTFFMNANVAAPSYVIKYGIQSYLPTGQSFSYAMLSKSHYVKNAFQPLLSSLFYFHQIHP